MQVKAGQLLAIKKKSEMANEDWAVLDRLRITRDMSVWVTYVDGTGTSFYVVRGTSDLQAFMPRGGVGLRNLSTFFEPVNRLNTGYVGSKHFTKRFPADF